MSRQTFGVTKSIPNILSSVPVAAVGLSLDGFKGSMKPRKWLLHLTVAAGPADFFLWGQRCDLDTDDTDDHTNGVWGLHNDKHGRFLNGKLAVGSGKLANGEHFFVVEDLGQYIAVGIQTDGTGTATAELTEILESERSG